MASSAYMLEMCKDWWILHRMKGSATIETLPSSKHQFVDPTKAISGKARVMSLEAYPHLICTTKHHICTICRLTNPMTIQNHIFVTYDTCRARIMQHRLTQRSLVRLMGVTSPFPMADQSDSPYMWICDTSPC